MTEHCPTCGHPVRIAGDDEEGTHYYEPAERLDVELLAKAMDSVRGAPPALWVRVFAEKIAREYAALAEIPEPTLVSDKADNMSPNCVTDETPHRLAKTPEESR